MIQRNKIRTVCFWYLVIAVVYLAVGCSKELEKGKTNCCAEPYANYASFVNTNCEFLEVDGFINTSENDNLYYSVSIPENSYFTENHDLYEDSPLQPKNKKDIFIDGENSILVWVSYLFTEEHLKKEFITIDEFPAEYETAQIEKIYPFLSESYECVLKEDHCITLIKFFPLNQLDSDNKVIAFRENVVSFIRKYCDFLDARYGEIPSDVSIAK